MSFGYLEKTKKGLPRSENHNSSLKMIRISREKTNNCHFDNRKNKNQHTKIKLTHLTPTAGEFLGENKTVGD